MKYRILLRSPVLPPGHTGPPPAKMAIRIEEYFFTADSPEAVVQEFEKRKAEGLEHLQGRTIKSIEPVESVTRH